MDDPLGSYLLSEVPTLCNGVESMHSVAQPLPLAQYFQLINNNLLKLCSGFHSLSFKRIFNDTYGLQNSLFGPQDCLKGPVVSTGGSCSDDHPTIFKINAKLKLVKIIEIVPENIAQS